jgi:arylformamidase
VTLIDITRPLSQGVAVWPGDTPYAAHRAAEIGAGDLANVGVVRMSLHTGTHADAPLHILRDGPPIDEVPLSCFVGPARVVPIGDRGPVTVEHLSGMGPVEGLRILFKTRGSERPGDLWWSDFVHVLPETAEWLVAQGVVLVGTDAPSVDPEQSTDLPSHHILLGGRVPILENLLLRGVPPGEYHLIALPLRLVGMDGSPVRAVLVTD